MLCSKQSESLEEIASGNLPYSTVSSDLLLMTDLDGWDGGRWEEGPRGRDIGAHIVDALHCIAES